jgi:hypothetical protein
MHWTRFSIVAATLTSATLASAQPTQIVPSDGIKTAEKTDADGWAPFLGLTSTIALTDNKAVVGQVDGFSTLFGLGLTGGADYVQGQHLWRNTLQVNESFARTPVVDEFVKTNDVVKLESLYNYFLTKELGGFGRLSFTTALFSATDVRGVATSWVEKNGDGTTSPLVTNGFRQRLAGAGKPFTINESVGGFVDPIKETWLNLSVRLGVGGRHTFADGVLLNSDDKATPEVELVRLSDVHQLGVEAFAGGTGKFSEGKASYTAGLSMLYPFVNNDAADRSATALTRIAFETAVTFNLYSWMGLVYNLSVVRDPQLFPVGEARVAVQNSLLLTFQFALVKKPAKPKEPTKEELLLKAAQDRADAAEQRAVAAERLLQQQKQSAPPVDPVVPPAPTAP